MTPFAGPPGYPVTTPFDGIGELHAGDPVPGAPVTVSALEFDVLWEHLGLGPMPLVVRVPSPGRTHQERAELVDRAWAELERRGLGGRRNGPDDRVATLLEVMARPEREVDGRIWLGRSVRILAAATGGDATLAVLDGDRLLLQEASPDGLPRAALEVLPPVAAGPGHSVTLPSQDLDAAATACDGTPEGLTAELRRRGTRDDDARTLARMVRGARHHGQFGAAARDLWGRRHRPGWVVGFFDTPDGRYLQLRRGQDGAPPWSTVSPADTRRLLAHVDELLGTAQQLAGR